MSGSQPGVQERPEIVCKVVGGNVYSLLGGCKELSLDSQRSPIID